MYYLFKKIIFVKFLVRFFAGLIGGIGLIFHICSTGIRGRESGVLYLISILGTVIFIAIIRRL